MQTLHFSVAEQRITWTNPVRRPVEGSRGEVFVDLALDEEWTGRTVTVLFTNSFRAGAPVACLWTGEPLAVPDEVLITGALRIGLIGLSDGGHRALTTIWMDRGVPVYKSGGTDGIPTEDAEPALWEQVLSAVGNLGELETQDKANLVAAINEAAKTGGSGGGTETIDNATLIRENGVLRVNTTNKVEQNNTQPITSAAVHATVGNIEVRLSTI